MLNIGREGVLDDGTLCTDASQDTSAAAISEIICDVVRGGEGVIISILSITARTCRAHLYCHHPAPAHIEHCLPAARLRQHCHINPTLGEKIFTYPQRRKIFCPDVTVRH